MIVSQTEAFLDNGSGLNLIDTVSAAPAYLSQRSRGRTIIGVSRVTPTIIGQKWTVQSIAIQAYLVLIYNTGSGAFGLLGKVLGGLLTEPNQQATGIGIAGPFQPIHDPTLTFPLWTPDSDPIPPTVFGLNYIGQPPSAFLPVSGILQLPLPVTIEPGESVAIGMWILPLLLGFSVPNASLSLGILFGQWTITYDNGV